MLSLSKHIHMKKFFKSTSTIPIIIGTDNSFRFLEMPLVYLPCNKGNSPYNSIRVPTLMTSSI